MFSRKGSCVKNRLLYFLLAIVLLLVSAHILTINASPVFHQKFNLDSEGNVPTWFSTILLFCIAFYSFRVYRSEIKLQNTVRLNNLFWGMMSAAFLFLSVDEGAQLHEVFAELHLIKWLFVYAPFTIIFLFISYYYLYCENCSKALRKWLVWGFTLYILGAFFFELFSYLYPPLPPSWQEVEYILEESLEMVGAILILVGTRKHWKQIKSVAP